MAEESRDDEQDQGKEAAEQPEATKKAGNVEFERLTPAQLRTRSVAVMAQAIDNQWLPPPLLREALMREQLTEDIKTRREERVLVEYRRALINGECMVINRAFVYNNAVIARDYRENGPARQAFKDLLAGGVIVPYLFTEQTPDEPPAFEVHNPSFAEWQKLCQQVRMHCIRLDWDDRLNAQKTQVQLARRFTNFASDAIHNDPEQYVLDLQLGPHVKSQFRKQLHTMAQECLDLMEPENKQAVSRSEMYKAFVTKGNPVEQQYDKAKPFASEIKQLLDLAYNSYLADAVGGHLLTPADSLPRTALQELYSGLKDEAIQQENLEDLLRKDAFSLAMGGLYLTSMGYLSLQDILEIRRMDEWMQYAQSLRALLKQPRSFAHGGAQAVYEHYIALAKRMTDRIVAAQRSSEATPTAQWNPVGELVFDVAGARLQVEWTREGIVYEVVGEDLIQNSSRVVAGEAPIVVRYNIRSASEMAFHADLVTSIDIMKGKLEDAENQWKALIGMVERIGGKERNLPLSSDPTINYQD